MRNLLPRFIVAIAGLAFSCVVASQPGRFGGGRGFLGGQGQQGAGNSQPDPATQREDLFAGTWTLEFELAFDSLNPRDTGDTVTVRADVTVIGLEVTGRFRRPAEGEFSCTAFDGSARCESGRMLIVWPGERDRQAADFEFVIDSPDGRGARGQANMINVDNSSMRQFTVHMTKR